ncbi:MAG: hypothetical protein GF393_09675 [Armatimonadia bacterium]|nr:hypothetical protein [Armatimonadia bacterium]
MADATQAEREPMVTWREIWPVIAWAVLVMALTALPYLWAIQQAEPGQQFQGFLWGVDDGNVYLSWIRQASEGRALLRNQYTTLPQNPHFFNAFLLALGRVTAWTGQHPGVIFHAARLLGGVVLLMAVYLLAAFLSRSKAVRWGALALASLGSGFGWLAAAWAGMIPDELPVPLHPPDYAPLPPQTWQVQPEAVTFLSLLLNPLFVWSMALMCLVLISAVVTLERKSFAWAALTGLLLLVIGNVHGYDIFALHATIVLFGLLSVLRGHIGLGHAAALYAVAFVIAAPAPIWAWWAANQDPAYMAKVETPTLSVPALDMAVGYGFVLLLALPGAWYALRRWRSSPRLMLPVCWALSHFALLYAVKPVAAPEFHWEPLFSFQRKMAEGMHIPLCVLAAVGLVMAIAPRLGTGADEVEGEANGRAGTEASPSRRLDSGDGRRPTNGDDARVLPAGARAKLQRSGARRTGVSAGLLIVLAVVLSMPSNAMFVGDCLHHVRTNNADLLPYLQPPIYLSFEEVRGIEAIAEEADEDEIVMCSSLSGSFIPTRARCLVFAGHWAETLKFGEAVDRVGQFLLPGRSPEVLGAWLTRLGADYVYYGPREALLAKQMMVASDNVPPEDPAAQFRDATRGFLLPIFDEGDVTVYEFRPELAPREPSLFDRGMVIPPTQGDAQR